MSDAELDLRAAVLRDAFDGSFAEPPPAVKDDSERFLAIEAAGTAYAIAQAEVAALFVDRPVAALPSAAPTCLGVAMLDGEPVAVHSLAGLLGHGASDGAPPRWTLRVAESALGLAFDRLDGQLRVPRDAIAPWQSGMTHTLIAASISADGATRPIVRLDAVVALLAATREE